MKNLANSSELRMIIKENEEADIRWTRDRKLLVRTLEEGYTPEMCCPLIDIKEPMEVYIQKNITKLRTQLPNCTGHCTTFGCPDGVVVNCYIKLKPLLENNKNDNIS